MFDGRDHTHAGAGLDCPDCHGPIDPNTGIPTSTCSATSPIVEHVQHTMLAP